LAGHTVNGSGNGARSGAQTLLLLAAPINVVILQTLADGPKQQVKLRRAAGSPAQTTLRAQLKRLAEIGAIEKHRRNRFPGVLEYELTPSGRDLLLVLDALELWLEKAPNGPLALGSNEARATTRALTEAWSTTMLRALAAGPLSLTELDGVIASLSYPALERRLAAMRLTSLIEAIPGNGRGTPYAVTPWLRLGVAPIAAAARWEHLNLPHSTTPIGQLDTETAFLLAMPLVLPPIELSGSCRLAAEIANGKKRRLSGVIVEVRSGGTIESCTTNLDGHADAWALGSVAAWLAAAVEGDISDLELGGNRPLSRTLVEGLHESLFGYQRKSALDVGDAIRDDGSN
jgi:DNA-binding HxlR family transcriptional regulator